jgi:TolB-like protein
LNLKKYISELKRRNVFKAAIAYLVVAWLVAQVASLVLPTFNAPAYFMKTLLFVFAIGFPICLVFAWIYEMTPEGIKKTEEVTETKSVLPQTGNKFNKLIIALLSLAVIFLLFNQFWNKSLQKTEKSNGKENITRINDNKIMGLIAVLPLSNTKSDPKTDYLGFAIADQIIGSLAYLKNISVRASSSIRKYENQTIDPIIVGNDLKVDYILNGNYLIEGEIIRLNIELVKVTNNDLVWRESIEVDYSNAFELQDIVSQKVVNSLNVRFSQNELNKIGKDVPSDPLAYEYYLRSISYPHSNEGHGLAIGMLKKSIELDSSFAPTYDQLGYRINKLAQFGLLGSKETERAESYFLNAISLNNFLISALGNLAELYAETARIEEALVLVRRMLDINPNNAYAHYSLGYLYRFAGMLNESIQEMEKALEIDPNNIRFRSLGVTYMNVGEYDKAFKALEINNGNSYGLGWQGQILFRQGKNDLSIDYFNRVIEMEPDGLWGQVVTVLKAVIEGDTDKGLIAVRKLEQANLSDAEAWYYWASFFSLLGDKPGCIRSFKRAVDGGYFNYPFMVTDPFFNSMRNNLEYQQILELAKSKHQDFKNKNFDKMN